MNVNPAQATAYIINPFTGRKVNFANLFTTHPPTEERIARLRSFDRTTVLISTSTPHRGRPALPTQSRPLPRAVARQSRKFVNWSGMPKSVSLQLGDHGLEVVPLLAAHAQLLALHLVAGRP